MDRDGQADVLFQHREGQLAVWLMDPLNITSVREVRALEPANSGNPSWRVVGHGDFNGDGNQDLVFQHSDGTIGFWMMSGTSQASSAMLNPAQPLDAAWQVSAVLDLNRDGKLYLVVQHTDGTMAVMYLNGLTLTQTKAFVPSRSDDTGWRIKGP